MSESLTLEELSDLPRQVTRLVNEFITLKRSYESLESRSSVDFVDRFIEVGELIRRQQAEISALTSKVLTVERERDIVVSELESTRAALNGAHRDARELASDLVKLKKQAVAPGPKRGTVYGHATSEDAEHWSGAFKTRDEAIEDGCKEYSVDDVDYFFIVEGRWIDPSVYIDVDSIIEGASDCLYDNGPDESELEVSNEAKKVLEILIKSWANDYASVSKWQAVGKPQRIDIKST